MINPEVEKSKIVAQNYYLSLKKLGIKEKPVFLKNNESAIKTFFENKKNGIKVNPKPKQGKNLIDPIDVAKVGRLHEKGLSVDKIAKELEIVPNKARYRLYLYKKAKLELMQY